MRMLSSAAVACLLAVIACPAGPAAEPEPAALAQKAQAVLKANCYRCHGQEGTIEGGLNHVSLSWARRIVLPRPVAPAQIVLRIDLRDFKWGTPVWTRIAADYPYGLLPPGPTWRSEEDNSPTKEAP